MVLPVANKCKFIILLTLLWGDGTLSFAQNKKESGLDGSMLKRAIEKAIEDAEALKGMSLGLAVKDLDSSKLLYSQNINKQYNIASNTKIITAAAALDILGPEFRLTTSVSGHFDPTTGNVENGLILRGRGDPSFWQEDLVTLVRKMKNKGVKQIAGKITVEGDYFDDNTLPPHFDEQKNEHAGFRAHVSSTSFNFNSFQLHIRPGSKKSSKAVVVVNPPNGYVKLENNVMTVDKGRNRIRTKISTDKNHTNVSIEGSLKVGSRANAKRYRVEHPKRFLLSSFIYELKKQGIKIRSPKNTRQKSDHPLKVIASHRSPPVAELVRGMGKYSNNYIAETLLKVIGAETLEDTSAATWEHSLSTVRAFLKHKVGIEPESYKYENGSGLFSSSLFTPGQMITVLDFASNQFLWSSDFMSSLAISGKDGTLANRMIGTIAAGKIRAKTGTLATSSALSGYVANANHKPVVFSLFMNQIPRGKMTEARQLQDDLMSLVVRYISNTNNP